MASTYNTDVRNEPETKNHAISPAGEETIVPQRKQIANKHTPEYYFKSGLAGGLAGCAAKTVVGPLDRVKILFQTSNPQFAKYTGNWFGALDAMRTIYRSDGMRGLFRGHSATLLAIFPKASIKFLAYEQARAVLIKDRSEENVVRRFLAGSIAGVTSVFFTYPLEVVRVRLAFETKGGTRASLSKICRQIYFENPPQVRQSSASIPSNSAVVSAASATASAMQGLTPASGLVNFYRGYWPTIGGMFVYAGSSFLAYDYSRDLLRQPNLAPYTTMPDTATASKPARLFGWAEYLAGGLAGFVSITASYPLEVTRRRMQVSGAVGDGRRKGMVETATKIYADRGWRGFFVGIGIGYVKQVPLSATSFFVYQKLKQYMNF